MPGWSLLLTDTTHDCAFFPKQASKQTSKEYYLNNDLTQVIPGLGTPHHLTYTVRTTAEMVVIPWVLG